MEGQETSRWLVKLVEAIRRRLHPTKAVDAMQAAASNTLAVLGAPMAEPTSSFDKVAPDAAASPPIPEELSGSVVSAFDKLARRVGPLYEKYSQPQYRKYHMALLVILYTLASIAVGKWMEITQRGVDDDHDDQQPVPVVPRPGTAETAPSVVEPKGPPANPRVEILHDRATSPVGASSTASAAEVHRTASALLSSGAEVRYRSYDSGSALDPDALEPVLAQRGVDAASSGKSSDLLMRDLLSLDPPTSSSSEDAPYAVLLLSTDHDLAFVVQTLKKRRYAPPACLAVVLDTMPTGSSVSDGLRLEDVADRVFFWDQEAGKIREVARDGGGSEASSDDELVETASETASDSSPEGESAQTSEPTSPPPTLSREGSVDEAPSTSDPPPEPAPAPTPAPAPIVKAEDPPPTPPSPESPRRERLPHPKSSKPGLVDGVYANAAAVPNTSLAYHSSRPSSRVPSRASTPPPAPILRTESPSPPRSIPSSMSKRVGAPSRIPISGLDGFRPFPSSPSELRRTPQVDLEHMREASISLGGTRAAAMTGLLSPTIRASFPLSPSLSGPFSSLPSTPAGRSASSPLPGMSVASTPGAGGNDFEARTPKGRGAKARQRVVSLGMLSPGFERMAESADARREAEEGRAAEAWRTGKSVGYPFPIRGSTAEEEDDAVE